MIPGLDITDAKRIALAICTFAPIVDLPEFHHPNAAEQLAGIPADLPRPGRSWINRIYMREVGLADNAPADGASLLTAVQRCDLITRYQFARFMAATLVGRFDGCPACVDQCRALLAWIDRGDQLREFIIGHEARLAWFIANRFKTHRLTRAEKMTVALEGLMYALERHDPSRTTLSTYAYKCIRGFLMRAASRAGKSDWMLNDTDCATSVSETGPIARQLAADQSGPEVHELIDLHRALAEPGLLNAEERYIIRRRFGVAGVGRSTSDAGTLEEVGEELGVTRERVRQVEEIALEKLRCRVLNESLPHTPAEIAAQARQRKRNAKRDAMRA